MHLHLSSRGWLITQLQPRMMDLVLTLSKLNRSVLTLGSPNRLSLELGAWAVTQQPGYLPVGLITFFVYIFICEVRRRPTSTPNCR